MNKKETIEEVVELLRANDCTITADFVRVHYANQEKPFDRWYVSETNSKYIAFEGVEDRFGIGLTGEWFNGSSNNRILNAHRLATDKEILEKLSAYATSIGIKPGVRVDSLVNERHSVKKEGHFFYGEGLLWITLSGKRSHCIMKDGKWATVVEQPKTLEGRIEAIEKHLGI